MSERPARPVPPAQHERRRLNAWDAAFLYLDTPATPMCGGFLHVYAPVRGESPTKRARRLRWHIERCIDASPVFRRLVERAPLHLDHGWFVDGADVDLDYHLRHHVLPAPGSDLELNGLLAHLAAQPMDLGRPLWEIHIIEGLDAVEGAPKRSFALYLKVHHAGVDGRSAAEMTRVLHSVRPARNRIGRLPPLPAAPAPKRHTFAEALLGGMRRFAQLNVKVAETILEHAPRVGGGLVQRMLRELRGGAPKPTDTLVVPKCRFNTEVDTDRCYTHVSFPLATIGAIREQVEGCTVNDVYLAVVGGALRRYLQHHRELPSSSLVTIVTMDIRPEKERGKGGNFVMVLRVPLGTDEPDAVARLTSIARATQRAKSQVNRPTRGGQTQKSANWADVIPAALLWLVGSANRARIAARLPPIANVGTTNVPGPREVLYLDGARMIDFHGAPPTMHGTALVTNATSYDGALRVSVYGGRRVLPDPQRMRQYLQDSFDELALPAAGRAATQAEPQLRP